MNITINIPDNIIDSINYCIKNNTSSALIQIYKDDTAQSIIERITQNSIQHFVVLSEKIKDDEMLNVVKTDPTIKSQVDSVISEKNSIISEGSGKTPF